MGADSNPQLTCAGMALLWLAAAVFGPAPTAADPLVQLVAARIDCPKACRDRDPHAQAISIGTPGKLLCGMETSKGLVTGDQQEVLHASFLRRLHRLRGLDRTEWRRAS